MFGDAFVFPSVCPCTLFQAIRDRRYIFISAFGVFNDSYCFYSRFFDFNFLNGFFHGYRCCYRRFVFVIERGHVTPHSDSIDGQGPIDTVTDWGGGGGGGGEGLWGLKLPPPS